MRKSPWIIPALLVFADIGPPNARADIITTYTITFTGASQALTPTGSFTYDSTVPNFTDFQVVWDGFTFDLTSPANSPLIVGTLPVCFTASSGAAATYSLLTDCFSNPNTLWRALAGFSGTTGIAVFDIANFDANGNSIDFQANATLPNAKPLASASGGFTATTIVTPEPGTLLLTLTGVGLFGLTLVLRKRTARALPQAS
jgi:hypothetical protein